MEMRTGQNAAAPKARFGQKMWRAELSSTTPRPVDVRCNGLEVRVKLIRALLRFQLMSAVAVDHHGRMVDCEAQNTIYQHTIKSGKARSRRHRRRMSCQDLRILPYKRLRAGKMRRNRVKKLTCEVVQVYLFTGSGYDRSSSGAEED